MTDTSNTAPRGRAALALALLVPAPTLGILAAAYVWPGSVLGQIGFGVFKVWLLALPIVWVLAAERHRPRLPPWRSRGMFMAIVTGAAIFVVIIATYWLVGDWIDTDAMVRQIEAVGLDVLWTYLAAAVYWCTLNSILEEYVWRWFVFTRCETLLPRIPAVLAAGLLFTVHHAVALAYYFDWRITLLGSAGVFIGGTLWSWIYLRWRNIYAAYVSHVFADLAVFGIGWHLVFAGGAA